MTPEKVQPATACSLNTPAPGKSAEKVQPIRIEDAPAMPTFQFEGYTLKPALPEHRDLARLWTEADPHHRGKTDPDFWLMQSDAVNSFLLEDACGPVFFFRMNVDAKTVGLHIQFPPDDAKTRRRLMQAMAAGFTWLEKLLGAVGYQTLYFHSSNKSLIGFCCRRFGFTWDGRKLIRTIG